jgi:peptide/nickel transport system ATP-binding protein
MTTLNSDSAAEFVPVNADRERGDVILRVENMRVSFPTDRGMLRAVDGVSLSVAPGTTTGIVGESGSGKSVLLRSVMNLLPGSAVVPEDARIFVDGRDVRNLDRNAARHFWGVDVAMVFQDPMTSLTPVLRIGRQIREPLRYHLKLSRAASKARAVELLQEVGIPEPARRLRQYPHNLSGGMRQRVTIAIALGCEPKLLMADEPTTALDVTIQHQILNLLQHTQEQRNMAMVLVTHDLGVVANRTDHIAVMYAGRIVERAPTRVLFKEMRHPYTEALLGSIPRISNASHTTLQVIPGRNPAVIDPPPGCLFAPRCRYAQPRCLVDDPTLQPSDGLGHEHACFFPVGTLLGRQALESNIKDGRTAANLPVSAEPTDGR